MIRVHLNDTAETFARILRRIQDVRACRCRSGVNAEVSQTADKRVGHDLERQRRKRFAVVGMTGFLRAVFQVTLDGRDIQRGRQVVDNSIQHQLYAFVLISGTAQNREEFRRADALTDRRFDFRNRWLFAFQYLHHQFIIVIGCFFDQLRPQLLRLFQHIRRDFLDFHLGSQIVSVEDRIHFQQVDDAAECVFRADRQLDRRRFRA